MAEAKGYPNGNPWSQSLTNNGNINFNVDAVLQNTQGAFGNPHFGDVLNIQQGGQLGIGPRVVAMDGGTPLALNACHVYVLQMPRFWDRFPATQRAYKSMIELNASNIDGIDLNYTLEFGDVEAGQDGQMASMPLKTKRAPVSPSITLNEIGGNLFWNMNYLWLKHINHPDTNASLLSALYDDSYDENDGVPAWVWSTFTMTWLVIQPDPTGLPSRMVEAAVITNMIPTETGNLGMKRGVSQAEVAKRTVSYKGQITHSESTRELGRLVMEAVQAHKPNLDFALTWDGTRANINMYGHQGWMQVAKVDGLLDGTNFVANGNAVLDPSKSTSGSSRSASSIVSTPRTYNT